MTSDSPPPSQELNYPPVRVDHSLTELDLDTLMMRSLATPRAEEPGSSLDDSTYDLLGDSQFETSDDEGHTASIASTDDRTPDDASEFSDDDDDFGMHETNVQESTYPAQDESDHLLHMQSAVSGDSSILTEIPGHMEDSDSMRQIKLDEHSADGSEIVQGSKTVKSYWAHESPEVFGRYNCNELRLVVRAALSDRPMPTPDAYRVLYIGMPDKWLEDTIVAKLGEALTASPSVSKSVVVRGQVEPYNPPIHVWRCTEFQPVIENGAATHVLAILDDGQCLRFGPKLNSAGLSRPDLVVFCHPTIPSTDRQDFANAEQVLRRENIPCINIGQIRSHGNGSPTYDSETLAMCVEGRDAPQDEFQLKEVLPLDHFAFSQLDALQLNRHLAMISPHLVLQSNQKMDQRKRRSWLRNACNGASKRLGLQGSLLKSLTLILMSLIIVPAVLQGVAYAPGLFGEMAGLPQRIDIIPSMEAPLNSVSCRTPISYLVSSPPSAVKPISSSTQGGLTVTTPQAEASKRRSTKKEAKVWQYEIESISDRQFVLKPLGGSNANRKKPQLRISVARDTQVVPIQYNRTIGGEYVIDLVREYPSGVFNVSIMSYSKPLLQQSFEIVLGHDKSSLDALLGMAKLHMLDAKALILDASSNAIRRLHSGLEAAEDVAHQQTAAYLEDPRLLQGARILREAPVAAWAGIRQVTAPIRTSAPMMRARQNALRVRCKIESAAGLSGEGDVKESWACAKLREL